MNLFFETTAQAHIFLATIPLGFALALIIDITSHAGHMRLLLDVLCLLVCGIALICLMLMFKDKGIRIYHLLALIIGAILYLLGVKQLMISVWRKLPKRHKKNNENNKYNQSVQAGEMQ